MKTHQIYLQEQRELACAAMRGTTQEMKSTLDEGAARIKKWADENPLLFIGATVAVSTALGVLLGQRRGPRATRPPAAAAPVAAAAAPVAPAAGPGVGARMGNAVLNTVFPIAQQALLAVLADFLATKKTEETTESPVAATPEANAASPEQG